MASAEKFHRHKSTRSEDLLAGLAASIVLHLVLLIGASNWLLTHAPERRQDSQPVPIKFVEVPPEETKPPKETKLRAAQNSSASGKAKPETSVSAPKSALTTAQKLLQVLKIPLLLNQPSQFHQKHNPQQFCQIYLPKSRNWKPENL